MKQVLMVTIECTSEDDLVRTVDKVSTVPESRAGR
jgi:hypothetical protein